MAGLSDLEVLLAQAQQEQQGFRGLFGMRGKRADNQVNAISGAIDKIRDNQAQSQIASLQASGVDTRQIPGLFGAAREGDVGGLLSNPQAPVQSGIAEQQAMAQQQASIDAQIQRETALANLAMKQREMVQDSQFGPGGRWGSGLTFGEFQGVSSQVRTLQTGVDSTTYLIDVIDQLSAPQIALSADIQGRMRGATFSLLPVVQGLMESKQSTLREGERAAIEEFLGNPDSWSKKVVTRDAKTIEKLRFIREAVMRNFQSITAGLDDRSLSLLAEGNPANPEMHNFTPPPGVLRKPELAPLTPEQEADLEGGFDALKGAPIF